MNRDYVIPDDVQALAHGVMGHSIILSPAARMRRLQTRRGHRPPAGNRPHPRRRPLSP